MSLKIHLKERKAAKACANAEQDYILARCNELPEGWKGALFDILTAPSLSFEAALEREPEPLPETPRDVVRTMKGLAAATTREERWQALWDHDAFEEERQRQAQLRAQKLFANFNLANWQLQLLADLLSRQQPYKRRYRNLPDEP